MKKLEQA